MHSVGDGLLSRRARRKCIIWRLGEAYAFQLFSVHRCTWGLRSGGLRRNVVSFCAFGAWLAFLTTWLKQRVLGHTRQRHGKLFRVYQALYVRARMCAHRDVLLNDKSHGDTAHVSTSSQLSSQMRFVFLGSCSLVLKSMLRLCLFMDSVSLPLTLRFVSMTLDRGSRLGESELAW